MWSTEYKPGYYIQGYCDKDECTAVYSPTGYGYEWIKQCKNIQAAKIAITKHVKARGNK